MIDGGVRRSITGHNRNYPLAAIQHRVCFELILTARQGEDAVFRSTRKNSRERVESISYTNHAAPIMIDRRAILPFFKRPNFFSEFLFFFFFFPIRDLPSRVTFHGKFFSILGFVQKFAKFRNKVIRIVRYVCEEKVMLYEIDSNY